LGGSHFLLFDFENKFSHRLFSRSISALCEFSVNFRFFCAFFRKSVQRYSFFFIRANYFLFLCRKVVFCALVCAKDAFSMMFFASLSVILTALTLLGIR